jgi:DNA-binding NarL/FixJ family response regulator
MAIRVGIVDDHPVVRDGMTALLREYADLEVVGTAESVESGRQLLDGGTADVVLLDLRLGQTSGLELLAGRGNAVAGPAVVVLTAFDHAEYVAAAARLGAAGFVLKTAPIGQLVAAIRVAAAGGTLGGVAAGTCEPTLTAREQEIVRCLVDGRTNDEIGAMLSIATKTVEGHLSRLFARLGIVSRVELAARAINEGWLDVPTVPRRRPGRPSGGPA